MVRLITTRVAAIVFSVDPLQPYQTRGRTYSKILKVAPRWPNGKFLYTNAPIAATSTMSTMAVVILMKSRKIIMAASTTRNLLLMSVYRVTSALRCQI